MSSSSEKAFNNYIQLYMARRGENNLEEPKATARLRYVSTPTKLLSIALALSLSL